MVASDYLTMITERVSGGRMVLGGGVGGVSNFVSGEIITWL